IYIYDLSADNIMIKSGEFYFVDLEGAYDSKDFKYLDKVYSNHFIDLNKSKEQSQVYSLMILLIYCVYDITKMFINEEKLDINRKFLPISNKTSYYNNIVHLINSMYLGKINLIEVVEYIESNINKIYKDLEIECFESKIADEEIVSLYENYNIKDTLQLIKLGLEDTYKQQNLRKKYEDYSYVNKGIKSGYPGIAYVLNEINGFQTCEKIDDVILSMFSGYLGNVWIDYDVEVSKIKSNLNFNINDSSLIHGLSGIGISLIKKYLTNKDSNTLIFIKKIADKLLQNNSTFEKNGLFYGASGISLFLLYFYKLTNYDNYLFTGQKILQNDLNNLIEDKFGCILLKQDQSNISSPYFMNGSVGVASVLLRYYLYTKNIEYKKIAITIMDSLIYNLSLHTGLFEGMSGIANTFLDCYFIVGDVKYLNVAKRMANDISNSLHINNKFISGYTRDGENLSFSFDYGSSGIALFLDRLVKQKKYNFIPFLDREMELIHEQNDK
ncbi:lanthionine synthetase LanC family protein, partial [Helcococcus bovis]|uniref:lanthionine synthetase LanC family protein n=1 Tax=Helcococcus bovis TaxID=3153252 RepID=UPI0038B6CB1F